MPGVEPGDLSSTPADDAAAEFNELTLAIQRLATIGDEALIDALRNELFNRLGMKKPDTLDKEDIAGTTPGGGNGGSPFAKNQAKPLPPALAKRAKALASDEPVQGVSYGAARVEKGYMAKAVVPAAQRALDAAGIGIKDCNVIKTHNPFAVNDIYFARELGIEAESFNNNGCSLIYGHPQGPTGARLMAEGIAEARLNGGGYILFAGCAAGDTAAAIVLKA